MTAAASQPRRSATGTAAPQPRARASAAAAARRLTQTRRGAGRSRAIAAASLIEVEERVGVKATELGADDLVGIAILGALLDEGALGRAHVRLAGRDPRRAAPAEELRDPGGHQPDERARRRGAFSGGGSWLRTKTS